MLINDFEIKPLDASYCMLSWTSESETAVSWIFLNGKFYAGPYMPETTMRSMEIPFSALQTLVVEIHEFDDLETAPQSVEIAPSIRPLIAWNAVETAKKYRLYHAECGGTETRLEDYPNLPNDRIEVNCPVTLTGRGGRWHQFRVESLDIFGRESENDGECMVVFAANLPTAPQVDIVTDSETGLLTFTIGE